MLDDSFHLGVCGTASFSLPQTAALLPLLFRHVEKEIDYVLRNFASQEELMTIPKPAALPVITQLQPFSPHRRRSSDRLRHRRSASAR